MRATSNSVGAAVLQIAFFLLAGTAVIVAAIRQKRGERQRALELRRLASQLAFDNFNPARDNEFAMGWGFLNFLTRGSDRYAFNILRGSFQGQSLFVFDFHYQTGSGKSREDHYCTVLMLIVKEAFPKLTIGAESLRAKIAAAFGIGDEIKFESAEFSRTFCVRSLDKKFAYDVCNPQMIEYLLANRGLQVEIQGPAISLAFEPQLPVGQIEFNLQRLAKIRTLLPEYLFAQTT
jgi:hypothetical protein